MLIEWINEKFVINYTFLVPVIESPTAASGSIDSSCTPVDSLSLRAQLKERKKNQSSQQTLRNKHYPITYIRPAFFTLLRKIFVPRDLDTLLLYLYGIVFHLGVAILNNKTFLQVSLHHL